MKLSRVRVLYAVLSSTAMGLAMISLLNLFPQARIFLLLGATVLIALSSYIDYHYWRCPHCHAHLGKRMIRKTNACPECGAEIDFEAIIK